MKSPRVQPDEADLIARARQGDSEAFGELVWRYRDTVFTLAVRLVGPDLAGDVAQEALIRAWRAMPRFRGDAALATWLHRITVNTAWTMRNKPNVEIASEAGIDIDHGIVVNHQLQTNFPFIYAAGDVAPCPALYSDAK